MIDQIHTVAKREILKQDLNQNPKNNKADEETTTANNDDYVRAIHSFLPIRRYGSRLVQQEALFRCSENKLTGSENTT